MRADERKAALKRVGILAGLQDTAIAQIAQSCAWHDFEASQTIVSYQDDSSDVLFLLTGKARVITFSSDGIPVLFADLAAPTMFGEIAAIDGKPRSASVEALEPCVVASLPAREFERLLLREPGAAVETLRALTAEVRRLSERVFEFSTMVVQGRVQAELIRLAQDAGHSHGEAVLSPAPSLADIASRISTHREAVSRELSRLTTLGLLRREHGGLKIVDMGRLARLVHQAKGEV
jgi:CRP-like cAMP-binding protein